MNSAIGVILLVSFIIVCVLIVLLVLVQDDGQSGMGGLLGGRGTAAFGSHSASVLTKATVVLVVLFFVIAFGLALVNKKPKAVEDLAPVSGVGSELESEEVLESTENGDWWVSGDARTSDAQDAEVNAESSAATESPASLDETTVSSEANASAKETEKTSE